MILDTSHDKAVRSSSMNAFTVRYPIVLFAVAAALSVGFHFLILNGRSDTEIALFLMSINVAALLLSAHLGKLNRWAFLFSIPALIAFSAVMVRSAPVSSTLGLWILIGSTVLFVYWLPAPGTAWNAIGTLWRRAMWSHVMVPLKFLRSAIRSLWHDQSTARLSLVGTGVLFSLPIVCLFLVLFFQADPFYAETVKRIFPTLDVASIVHVVIDVIIFFFFLAGGWAFLERTSTPHHPARSEVSRNEEVVAGTILTILNIVFLTFVIAQFAYFFGSQSYISSHGVTYATYAREGFGQLLAVAGFVFAGLLILYRYGIATRAFLRDAMTVLVIQTFVIGVSAISRLTLYVQAYGLTVARVWAMYCLLVVIGVLGATLIALWRRIAWERMFNTLVIATLCLFSVALLPNIEGMIVRWNIEHQDANKIDWLYAFDLSSDAIPSLITLPQTEPENVREKLKVLTTRSERPLSMSVSDWIALSALQKYRR